MSSVTPPHTTSNRPLPVLKPLSKKPHNIVWKHFVRFEENGTVKGSCRYCGNVYVTHADRMMKHLLKCAKCPVLVKDQACTHKNTVRPNIFGKNAIATTSKKPNDNLIDEDINAQFVEEDDIEACEVDNPDSVTPERPINSYFNLLMPSKPTAAVNARPLFQSKVDTIGFIDKMNSKEQLDLQQMWARAMYAGNVPFSFVENPYLVEFFKKIRPTFVLPSRKQMADRLLDTEYSDVETKVANEIRSAETVTIASDGWSNLRNESILNYMVMTPKPLFYKYTPTVEERHTAEYIFTEFVKVIDVIGESKVKAVVTDNASNMRAAWNLLEAKYTKNNMLTYGCAAHIMQLFVGDVGKLESFNKHSQKCKEIIKFFKNKQVPAAVFKKKLLEKKIGSGLSLPCPTRWGTHIKCIKDMETCKPALLDAVVDCNVAPVCPKSIRQDLLDEDLFWTKNAKFIELLAPIPDAIKLVEGDTALTSDAKHAFQKIESHIKEHIARSPLTSREEKEIVRNIEDRHRYMATKAHISSYLLDPRYVGDGLNEDQFEEACELICSLTNAPEDEVLAALYKSKTGTYSRKSLWASVSAMAKGVGFTPLTWWTGLCSSSLLCTAARTLLALPASAASSERNWSVWGIIHSKLRNRLGVARAGKLVYIYHNLRLLKGMQAEVGDEDAFEPDEEEPNPVGSEDFTVNIQEHSI